MKKLFLRLGLITALSLALFSCDKADQHQNLIPKDADAVLMINPAQIAEKAELSSSENAELINNFVESFNDNAFKAQIKELIKNPEKSGLDVKAPIYGFMNFPKKGEKELEFLALTFKLKSAEDFRAVIQKLNPDSKFVESDIAGFKTIKPEGVEEFVIATKDNQGLLLGGEAKKLEANLKAILEQKEDASFATTEVFAKMNETKEDFEAVVNYGKFAESMQENTKVYATNPFASLVLEEGRKAFPLNEVYYLFALNSEKGALKLSTDLFSKNEKFAELLEQSAEMSPEAKDTFLDKLPKNAFFALNFALNGEKIWEFAQKHYPKTMAEAQEQSKDDLAEIGVTLEDIIKVFEGDIAFSIAGTVTGIQRGEFDARTFIELSNKETAVKLLDKLTAEEGISYLFDKVGENQYLFKGGSTPVLFGLKDNVFFLGSKQNEGVDGLFAEAKPNIKESSFGNQIQHKRVAMIINVSEILRLAKPTMGFMFNALPITQLEQIDYVALTNTDKLGQAEMVLKLKNDQNPYVLLLEMARKLH